MLTARRSQPRQLLWLNLLLLMAALLSACVRADTLPRNTMTGPADYKLIFVGDATMGPYEISYPGGSVEHFNALAGEVWLQRLLGHFSKAVWLNPQPLAWWAHYQSIDLIQQLMKQRMYDLSLDGLSQAIRTLQHK